MIDTIPVSPTSPDADTSSSSYYYTDHRSMKAAGQIGGVSKDRGVYAAHKDHLSSIKYLGCRPIKLSFQAANNHTMVKAADVLGYITP